MSLCVHGKSGAFYGCFVWALVPPCFASLLFLFGETQSGRGICVSSVLVFVVLFFVWWFAFFVKQRRFILNFPDLFARYPNVASERYRPQQRKKTKLLLSWQASNAYVLQFTFPTNALVINSFLLKGDKMGRWSPTNRNIISWSLWIEWSLRGEDCCQCSMLSGLCCIAIATLELIPHVRFFRFNFGAGVIEIRFACVSLLCSKSICFFLKETQLLRPLLLILRFCGAKMEPWKCFPFFSFTVAHAVPKWDRQVPIWDRV